MVYSSKDRWLKVYLELSELVSGMACSDGGRFPAGVRVSGIMKAK
jgi:hypothetical protein